jgi:hypothetical protein
MEALVRRLLPISHTFSSYMEERSLVSSICLTLTFFIEFSFAAYDLKLLLDKGIYDVLKPRWITDSITLGHPAPFKKKYGLH